MNENEAISDEKHEAGSGFLVFWFCFAILAYVLSIGPAALAAREDYESKDEGRIGNDLRACHFLDSGDTLETTGRMVGRQVG